MHPEIQAETAGCRASLDREGRQSAIASEASAIAAE
jgi:hypothetical protein